MRGEALILNFGELKRRLLEGGAYFRGGANSNIYITLFYLKIEDLSNDIMKSKLTLKQHAGVNYYNFPENVVIL